MRTPRAWKKSRWSPRAGIALLAFGIAGCASKPVEEPPAQIEDIAVAEEAPEPLPPTDVQDVPPLADEVAPAAPAPKPRPHRTRPHGLRIAKNEPVKRAEVSAPPPPPVEAPAPAVEEPPPPPPAPEETMAPPPPPPEPSRAEVPPPPPPPAEEPFYLQPNVQLAGVGIAVLLAAWYFFSKRKKG